MGGIGIFFRLILKKVRAKHRLLKLCYTFAGVEQSRMIALRFFIN